jgi:hypothetical protein
MNKNIKNILKEKLVFINLNKLEVFRSILKSINQNNNINNNIKIYSGFLLEKKLKKNFFLSKKHKICLLTGKRSSILKGYSFSRYMIKSLILKNKFTNLKKKNN